MAVTVLQGARIQIKGIVQGVGFRPFVYSLATRLGLTGWVRNTSAGVDIRVDGTQQALDAFLQLLHDEAPPLARIDGLISESHPADGFLTFEIIHSEAIEDAFQPVSPDVSICPDCLRELFDPGDRRYRYPFINCTNCGPRFTIVKDIPYDRPKTTMAGFELCPECAAEYQDPLDRRFHAQPVACPVCGPHVWLEYNLEMQAAGENAKDAVLDSQDAISVAQQLLATGQILAIKGLGGFHLACDAINPAAVATLRQRKLRVDKPFALMMPDLETVTVHCHLNEAERQLLSSRQRPIVILHRRPGSQIATEVAPGQDTIGVMLPYTPLHYLLFSSDWANQDGSPPVLAQALVMTSGNLSEEPIAIDNEEARQRLSGLADAFLMHNRPIHTRCDDSVMRVFSYPESQRAGTHVATRPDARNGQHAGVSRNAPTITPLRRSRGYAPFPVRLPWELPAVLGVGAELKNTFCITREQYAFLSHHIGDLENYETLRSFEEGLAHFERLFRIVPQALAYDLHPDYLATRYALARARSEALPAFGVQHHHAHIAACMGEHGLVGDRPVLGLAFDGTGYGEDGAIWGGELLLADYRGYRRIAHLDYIPLPGGDQAVRAPWRVALAWLDRAGIPWEEDLPPVQAAGCCPPSPANDASQSDRRLAALRQQLRSGLNAPPTSSMGRLFDAAAALAGVRQTVNYEAQAAIELEAVADPDEQQAYRFDIHPVDRIAKGPDVAEAQQPEWIIDPVPFIWDMVGDRRAGRTTSSISARFHNGVVDMVLEICSATRRRYGISEIVLSGGVWQNMTLFGKTMTGLSRAGFTVLVHQQVPANDGGLALGQAIIAGYRMKAAC